MQCREIGFEIHEEVLKVLHELHTAMKTHHAYQSEFRQAESKLQVVEKQRTKIRDQISKEKLEKSRKFRLIEKEVAKRTAKYTEARLKATKARNEYLLCMDAANSSIHKYFMDDLSDLIDCMDFGFHQSLSRAMMMRSSAMEQVMFFFVWVGRYLFYRKDRVSRFVLLTKLKQNSTMKIYRYYSGHSGQCVELKLFIGAK